MEGEVDAERINRKEIVSWILPTGIIIIQQIFLFFPFFPSFGFLPSSCRTDTYVKKDAYDDDDSDGSVGGGSHDAAW